MVWLSEASAKWLLVTAGLLSTSCVGAIGVGVVAVAAGAGAIAYTCYDRVSVTVTDRLTGAKLCDAKVAFIEGESETVASSCYQAALSKGKYTLRVERPGLAPFEEPVEVVRGENCGQTVQTMYVALDRLNREQPAQQIVPRAAAVSAPPLAPSAPSAPSGPSAPPAPPAAAVSAAPAGPTPPGASAPAGSPSPVPPPAPAAPAPGPSVSPSPSPSAPPQAAPAPTTGTPAGGTPAGGAPSNGSFPR